MAGRLWGAVAARNERGPLGPGFDEFIARLAAESETRFVAGVETGRALELDDAVALALGEDQTLP